MKINPDVLRLAIIGYGKMGKAIEEIAMSEGHEVVLKIHSGNTSELNHERLAACDIAFEFTGPATAVPNMIKCFEASVPVVCGSTGWLDEMNRVKELCVSSNAALLYASNFSIGVNIFFEINRRLAKLMKARSEYDVSIEETHHVQKKDAPSGTAITIAEDIISSFAQKTSWKNGGGGNPSELIITSKRFGSVPGTHVVNYASHSDTLTITHTAHSRRGFAEGAITAARFLIGKKGIFTMSDVLA